jgi:hypothetical protein
MLTQIMNCSIFDFNTDNDIDRDNFKSFDFGVTAGLEFQLDPILLGFKYNLGLMNVAEDNSLVNY